MPTQCLIAPEHLILFRRLLSRGHELNVRSIGCHGSANNHNFLDNFFLSLERDFVLFCTSDRKVLFVEIEEIAIGYNNSFYLKGKQ